jgi:hypothetical protein
MVIIDDLIAIGILVHLCPSTGNTSGGYTSKFTGTGCMKDSVGKFCLDN